MYVYIHTYIIQTSNLLFKGGLKVDYLPWRGTLKK